MAFGIIVAIIGVIAYLRMFRKNKLQEAPPAQEDVSSPNLTYTAASRENEDKDHAKSEQADTRD
ncbi:hypothetical protein D3C85_1637240 [compost metagenome]